MFTIYPNNFLKLDDKSIFKYTYMYIDVERSLIEDQFEIRHIPIKYICIMKRPMSGPYVVKICKIPKRYDLGFKEVMLKLNQRAKLAGYTDYNDVCKRIMDDINKWDNDKYYKKPWYKYIRGEGK